MNRALRGVPAAPGAALAEPWRYVAPSGGGDRLSLDEASAAAERELLALAERLRGAGREEEAGILDAQALMATDPELLAGARRAAAEGASASEAILAAGAEQAAMLAGLDDEVLAARAADVRDVAERMARLIRGQRLPSLERRSVAVAADLPPSVTAELDPRLLAGIALEGGSPTAHAAILARALRIPAVVGVAGLLEAVDGVRLIGVDGEAGVVALDPDAAMRDGLEAAERRHRAAIDADAALRDVPLATSDGQRITLAANIGRPEDAPGAVEAGAEAVGLFRTEFMFMGRTTAPSVEEQARAYAAAFAAFGGRPVVVRTLDVGGDKGLPYVELPHEENPFMGVRALRLAAGHRELLVEQLRAILLAAQEAGAVAWVMAPMVADLGDVALLRELVAEAAGAVPEASAAAQAARIGVMVELPAAALLADQLAARVDFFSIGTNDLTQYLLAADRTNPALAARQDAMHPAVLRAVRGVVESGRRHGIGVAVCGELAGDPTGAQALAGLGVDELSMDPARFGAVKRALGAFTLDELQRRAAAACEADSAAAARAIMAGGL